MTQAQQARIKAYTDALSDRDHLRERVEREAGTPGISKLRIKLQSACMALVVAENDLRRVGVV